MTRFLLVPSGRLLVAIIFVAAALVAADLFLFGMAHTLLSGVLAITLPFYLSVHLAQRAEEGNASFLTGRSRRAARVPLWTAVGCFSATVLGTILILLLLPDGAYYWLSERGGFPSVLLTLALSIVAILLVSLVARFATFAVQSLRRARSQLVRSKAARRWDALDAGLMLAALVVATYVVLASGCEEVNVTYRTFEGEVISPGTPTRSLADASDEDILIGLAPILTLSSKEAWPPQTVTNYLRESELVRLDGDVIASPAHVGASAKCSPRHAPCLLVRNTRCPASEACRKRPLAASNEVRSVPGYGRVVRRGDSDSGVRWSASPYGEDLIGFAQWWLFAPYDEWHAPLALGLVWISKRHQADWEAVTIGFSEDRPLFVALTSHCGGSTRNWSDVYVHDTQADRNWNRLGPRLHPLVAYGDGSHALYHEPESSRSPDSFGCEVGFGGLLRAGLFASNVRDVTGDERRVVVEPVRSSAAEDVLELPAYWGASTEIGWVHPFGESTDVRGTPADPKGPSSPATKALYGDPIGTIFCSSTWRRIGIALPVGRCR